MLHECCGEQINFSRNLEAEGLGEPDSLGICTNCGEVCVYPWREKVGWA